MCEHDAAVASLGDEPIVSLVGVDLKNTAEALQFPRRMLVASPRGVDIGDGGWGTAAPRALVASITPQTPGLAATGIEHRQGRVVAEDHRRGDDAVEQALVQKIEPPSRPSDPLSQGRAIEIDAMPGEDPGLAIERTMVRILADDDMGDQRFGGHAAIDQAVRRWGLHDRTLARPTAVVGPAGGSP